MLKPSYSDLMETLNAKKQIPIYSRYSIVIAAAKRARQLVEGAEPYTQNASANKPVSIAVQELYEGHISIVSD